MAIAEIAHFSLSNDLDHFSQDFLMTSSNNLCPFPPQILDFRHEFSHTLLQQNQQSFVQGIGYDRAQDMSCFSNPCSSSATFTNNIDTSFMTSIVCSQPFSELLDKQHRELDLYLHFHGERLKEALQQQKKQQMALILNSYQSRTVTLLREKEKDLEILWTKTKMLEEYLRKKEEEIEVWQRIAREKEEMVIELNNLMNQKLCNLVSQQNNYGGNNDKDDAESVCDCESLKNSIARQNNGGGSHYHELKKYGCKRCKCKELCVVFLPCKHLCCCKECEPLLQFCLVCQCVKQGSMEVLLS